MFKTGYVTIIGKPNVGKSTLINYMVGEKISIVSFRPQTTRDRVLGIVNDEDSQLILVDTPGIHNPKNRLSEYMMKNVSSSIDGVDAIVYIIACDKVLDEKEISQIQRYASMGTPFFIAINKCDEVKQDVIFKKIEQLKDVSSVLAIIPISAKTGKNVDYLKSEIKKILPEAEARFDEDEITDKSTRFIVGEYIREKALKLLGDEIPYGVGIVINKFQYRENGIVDIDADIVCEKQAHKSIIIGKNGAMIKEISSQARKDMEELLQTKVFLTIFVKVKEDWRNNPSVLSNLGYSNNL
ncbi:MAG: GTPase Era [Christensenella sp.]|nr:GTPase Era [Christensenella sp.]